MTKQDTPLLVIVTGPPGAGKTTVARELARALRLPLLTKDTVKEALFDGLGAGGVEWSKRLGVATYSVLFALLRDVLAAGAGAVVEANFVRSEAEHPFSTLPPARIVQIHCDAPADVLLARYASRTRHPGHVDAERSGDVRRAVESNRHAPLALDAETIALDTTEPPDLAPLVERLRTLL